MDNTLLELPRGSITTSTLADLDDDGDFDLLGGSSSGRVYYFRNKGTAQVPEFKIEELPFTLRVSQFSAPHITDLDGDDTPEILSGTREGGVLFFSAH